jgi:hypothetical protein
MNSMEDILQDIFMRDRSTVYVSKPKSNGLKKVLRSIKVGDSAFPGFERH